MKRAFCHSFKLHLSINVPCHTANPGFMKKINITKMPMLATSAKEVKSSLVDYI